MHGFATRTRAAREGPDPTNLGELPIDLLFKFYQSWKELDDEIEDLQQHKKTLLANVRSKYGRHQAEALRITMRLLLADKRKRIETLTFNEMASRYVDLIEGEIEAREAAGLH